MTSQLIETAWLSYRDRVVHRDAGPDQVRETQMAFYAGATVLFTIIMNILDPGQEATDRDLQVMTGIDEELKRFAGTVEARIPKGGTG